jgi:putative tryptophan/tyrosine transport system substrate-binding protein
VVWSADFGAVSGADRKSMRRRDFIKVVGYAVAWPLTVSAQQPTIPVIGYLGTVSAEPNAGVLRAFRQGLKEIGYIEGQNLAIEYRWAEQNDGLPALATDLVDRKLAAIVADSTPSVQALQAATSTIPIIFLTGGDPVALGLVASLNRPGGNLTGTTILWLEMRQKWLQLLHDSVPTANTFALLVNPTSRVLAEAQSQNLEEAARTLGLQLHVLSASTDSELNTAFATLTQLRVGGLVISSDAFFYTRIAQLAALAARHSVPAIFGFSGFPAAGGLMSYGSDINDAFRQIGLYTGRVLKGEKPADLPVVQSVKVQLVINLKTAKALGLTVPATLLATADEVIE